MRKAQAHQHSGRRWVVDLDLEKFFDYVNHDILLDDFDKELERRGHHFVRYADDCTIYVASKRAGHRVLESVTEWLGKRLRLKAPPTGVGLGGTVERVT